MKRHRHAIAAAVSTVAIVFAAGGGTALACGGPPIMPSSHVAKHATHASHHGKRS